MSNVIRIGFALSILTVALASCGDDGGSDGLTFAEWQERTTAVCNEYEPRVQAQNDEQPEVESAQDLVDLIDALTELNVEYREALVGVGVPVERAEEVEALHEDLQVQEDLVMEVREAAVAGELESSAGLLESVGSRADDLNQRAQELGVPACDSRLRRDASFDAG